MLQAGNHKVKVTWWQGWGGMRIKATYIGPDTRNRERLLGANVVWAPPKVKKSIWHVKVSASLLTGPLAQDRALHATPGSGAMRRACTCGAGADFSSHEIQMRAGVRIQQLEDRQASRRRGRRQGQAQTQGRGHMAVDRTSPQPRPSQGGSCSSSPRNASFAYVPQRMVLCAC